MRFVRALAPASQARIERIQKHHGVHFPSEFVELLKRHNGARVEDGAFESAGHSWVLDRFLPLLDDYRENEEGEWDVAVVITYLGSVLTDGPDEVGSRLIPIGLLTKEDYLCLDFRVSKTGPAVVILDVARSTEWNPAVIPVANSLPEFFDMVGAR